MRVAKKQQVKHKKEETVSNASNWFETGKGIKIKGESRTLQVDGSSHCAVPE